MKNLVLLGLLFFSSATFAQNTEEPETVESLNGSVDGFSVRNGDDKIDFGLVIPTLTKAQVMDFNLSYVLSSETSVIRAAGQRINVPSNLSLPKQNERYIFFNVRIDKPEFKLPITTSEPPTEVVALQGSFPFASTVDVLRAGRPLFSVINSFTFSSYSVASVVSPEEALELSVGENDIEGETVEFTSPFSEDEDFVNLGLNMSTNLSENGPSRYFPIDVKTLEESEFLKTDTASDTIPIVVSIPKAVFDSATDASALPFPFTMVWGEANPAAALPLAKNFMALTEVDEVAMLEVDFQKIADLESLGMKSTFTDESGDIIQTAFEFGGLKDSLWQILVPENTKRIRVDVYAIDADPILASIIVENAVFEADILNQAKYITRYEEDIN